MFRASSPARLKRVWRESRSWDELSASEVNEPLTLAVSPSDGERELTESEFRLLNASPKPLAAAISQGKSLEAVEDTRSWSVGISRSVGRAEPRMWPR